MFRNKLNRFLFLLSFLSLAAAIPACSALRGDETAQQTEVAAGFHEVPGGDPQRGRQAILDYGCHSCHTIPGVPGANATVGPPLTDFAERQYLAGSLENTTENLMLWIMEPQEIEPGTAMPNLGVDEQAARDVAAYLYTLER